MKSQLTFLAAAIAAGSALLFTTAKAQELPTALQSIWLTSSTVTYDPLLAASFVLAMTLAVGRTVDVLSEENHHSRSHWIST